MNKTYLWTTLAILILLVAFFNLQKPSTENAVIEAQPVSTPVLERQANQMFNAVNRAWTEVFNDSGFQYRKPNLILTNSRITTPCGVNSPFSPFYCPSNSTIYISAAFNVILEDKGATGDKAFGYVVAHEVAHHVEHQFGILHNRAEQEKRIGNRASRIVENLADCMGSYSVYYAQANHFINYSYSDLPEMLNGASSVGCDHTSDCSHGSNEQREKAVIAGYREDGLQQCEAIFSWD